MVTFYRLPQSIFDTTDEQVPRGYAGFSHIPNYGSFVLYEQPLNGLLLAQYGLEYAGEKPPSKTQIRSALGTVEIAPNTLPMLPAPKARGRYALPETPEVIHLPAWNTLPLNTIVCMDALDFLKSLPDASVHCIVTSIPYFGLRDYGVNGQIGREEALQEYVTRIVQIMRECRRVLRPDGTLWLNIGDSFSYDTKWGGSSSGKHGYAAAAINPTRQRRYTGLPGKNLLMVPHRVAIAMQADGWIVRMDNIWDKPNPMPGSQTDRPTLAHEYVFLMTKSPKYWYDIDATRTPLKAKTLTTYGCKVTTKGGKVGEVMSAGWAAHIKTRKPKTNKEGRAVGANMRSVWRIATEKNKHAHFAVMPQALAERCIKAGCPVDGIVLDPFMGSGTTAVVARRLGRNFIGCDLNKKYVEMAHHRLAEDDPFEDKPLNDKQGKPLQIKQMSMFAR